MSFHEKQRTRNIMSLGALAAISIPDANGAASQVQIFERHEDNKLGGNLIATVSLDDLSLADQFGRQLRTNLSGFVSPSASEYDPSKATQQRVFKAAKRALDSLK